MTSLLVARRLPLLIGLVALSTLASRTVAQVDGVEVTASHPWTEIKNDTYEQRAHFQDGTGRMVAKLDHEIAELKAKRVDLTTDTKDWDFLMKDVNDCRALLVGRIEDIAKMTTPETWADAKEKVGEAWHKAQLAVDKMNSS